MKYLFSRSSRKILARFARSNTLLAFDFDGTLAPIVTDPAGARIPQPTRAVLERICRLYPCAVISGRSKEDLAGRVRGLHMAAVIGNHGVESSRESKRFERRVSRWLPLLERELAGSRGVIIENKRLSLAIHYRSCRDRRKTRDAILRAVGLLGPIRVIGGKCVVNVLPEGAAGKGIALERAQKRLGCDTAIYVGDDDTDEDVFRAARPVRTLGVRVGFSGNSAASLYLRSRSEINLLLRSLLALRQCPNASGKPPEMNTSIIT